MSLIEILVAVVIVLIVLAEVVAKLRHETLKQEFADLKALFKKAPVVTQPAPAPAPAAAPVTINVHTTPAPAASPAPVAAKPAVALPTASATSVVAGTPPFAIDPATGFIAVWAEISQSQIVADGSLCSVLALPYLDPKSAAYQRVVQNCALCSTDAAATVTFQQNIWHNTAYDVDLQSDGSYKLNTSKVMLKNFVVPTEVNAKDTTTAYCNAYPVAVNTSPSPQGAGDGHAKALMAARRAAKAAK